MKNPDKVNEPLFHIIKRNGMPSGKAWIIRIISVFAALIICGIITVLVTGENPFEVYGTMISGAVGTERKIWATAQNTAILLCISLAITPAFKMKFWNIGAEGQVLMGAFAAATCMIFIGDKIPNWALILIMVAASVVAGAIWGLIPAFFKANWNTNETLFTLMMNYLAMQIVSYFVFEWSVPAGSGHIGIINPTTNAGWFPVIFEQKYFCNIIIAVALTAFMFVYLKYSKHGYELSVVGGSENTAKYIGINVKKVVIRTMLLSGALCGIAGLLIVAGTDHTVTKDSVGGRGFTAIMVSWLAKFNPIYMIITALLIVFLQKGAGEISMIFGLNESFSDIITGIIIFFIIGSEFFINYKIKFREKQKEVNN